MHCEKSPKNTIRELGIDPEALVMESRVLRGGGAARHVHATRVAGVGTVVSKAAGEDALLFEQQRRGEVFMVSCQPLWHKTRHLLMSHSSISALSR
jgi:hypothetical protein